MKALVVDDSRAMRMVISKLLREIGFEVREAEHGRAALNVIEAAGPFDVALVDWNMPVMNGLELVAALRRDERNDAMRVLMVTTETETTQIVRALEAGASEYLMKPFTKDGVVEKLALVGLELA